MCWCVGSPRLVCDQPVSQWWVGGQQLQQGDAAVGGAQQDLPLHSAHWSATAITRCVCRGEGERREGEGIVLCLGARRGASRGHILEPTAGKSVAVKSGRMAGCPACSQLPLCCACSVGAPCGCLSRAAAAGTRKLCCTGTLLCGQGLLHPPSTSKQPKRRPQRTQQQTIPVSCSSK